jgi:WD40 repeat protein
MPTRLILLTVLALAILAPLDARRQTAPADVSLVTQLGHTAPARAVAMSSDGRYVLSGSDDNTACLWEAATGLEIRRFAAHRRSVIAVGFFPDGRRIFTASWDGFVRIYDMSTGAELAQLTPGARVFTATLSADGKMLATGSEDGTARLWDPSTGRETRRITTANGWVEAVAIAPDLRTIVTASRPAPNLGRSIRVGADRSNPSTLQFWDPASGAEKRRAPEPVELVQDIGFSPDGRLVVSASGDGIVRLWDVQTGREVRRLEGHRGTASSVAFSPDGRTIVSGGFDETVRIWDAATGAQRRQIEARSVWQVRVSSDSRLVITGEGGGGSIGLVRLLDAGTGTERQRFEHGADVVTAAVFARDGNTLFAIGRDRTIRVWDARTGHEQFRIGEAGAAWNPAVVISPDGRSVVAASGETVRRWDVATRRESGRFDNPRFELRAGAFSPDGTQVVGASSEGMAYLWDAQGEVARVFDPGGARASRMLSVAVAPTGAFLASGGEDGIVRVWPWRSGDEQQLPGHTGPVTALAISPDGRTILSGGLDATARLWSTAGRQVLAGHTEAVRVVAFSTDGRSALTGSGDGTVRIWDARTGAARRTLSGDASGVVGIAALEDGGIVAASANGTLRLWSAAGKLQQTWRVSGGDVLTLGISPDRRTLATAGADGVVHVLSLATRTELRQLRGHAGPVRGVAFSADGAHLLSVGADGSARVWAVATGAEARRMHTDRPAVTDVALTPDGSRLLTASVDGVRVWDTASTHVVRTFTGHAGPVLSIAVSPDGTRAASAGRDRIARVWDIATGIERQRLTGHQDQIGAVAFSPDGRRLATGGFDGIVAIWDIASGRLHEFMQGHTSFVTGVAFSPDGRLLASVANEPTVRVWDAQSGAAVHRLDARSPANSVTFTPDGRAVVTAAEDGLVRVWDASSGDERCRLVSFRSGAWAVVDREGRYDASRGGAVDGLHWVRGLNVIALEQLKSRYYDPGLLAKALGLNAEPVRDVRAFASVAMFPAVQVLPPDPASATIRIRVTDQGGGIGPVAVWLNGKELTPDARGPKPPRPIKGVLELSVPLAKHPLLLPGGQNEIEVRAHNAEGYLASRGLRVPFKAAGTATKEAPRLWAVVTGVSDYDGTELDLRFAAKDAIDFAAALRVAAQRLFGSERAHVVVHTTQRGAEAAPPTKEMIVASLQKVAREADPRDVVVVYFAGHGVSTGGAGGDFFFLTREARNAELGDPAVRRRVAISSEEFTELLKAIPARKQVLVLDTCGAGRVVERLAGFRAVPSSQIRALERMKDRTGLFVLAGAAADAVSYEASPYGQGLLTYSLLAGMRGAALRDDEFVDVSRLFAYAVDLVPQLASGIGGIQQPLTAAPLASASFDIGSLGSDDRARIPLAAARPVVTRAVFQDEARLVDHLGVAARVNDELRGAAARGADAPLVFIDAGDYPGARTLSGTYRVSDGRVTVTAGVFDGSREVGRFRVEGRADALPQLAREIVVRAEALLIKQ